MKALIYAILICAVLAGMAAADTPGKLTLDAKAMTLKDAAAEISRQSGAAIVVDPKATGAVTASLNGADLDQVLDVITKSNNLTWKKLQFAHQSDSKATLDQLKAGILAIANMPFVGLSVEDRSAKSTALFTRSVPAELSTSKLALPEGYAWSTVYVILSPEPLAADKSKPAASEQTTQQQTAEQQTAALAKQKEYFRNQWAEQMSLTPEARRSLMRTLPPEERSQLRKDMIAVFGKKVAPKANRK
jgi:hypothetical protein